MVDGSIPHLGWASLYLQVCGKDGYDYTAVIQHRE